MYFANRLYYCYSDLVHVYGSFVAGSEIFHHRLTFSHVPLAYFARMIADIIQTSPFLFKLFNERKGFLLCS